MSGRSTVINAGPIHATAPHPTHFLCRENGEVVPVIAVDDLPTDVQIRGVPRVFAGLNDTVGMINLGIVAKPGQSYILDRVSDTFTAGSSAASLSISATSPMASVTRAVDATQAVNPWRRQASAKAYNGDTSTKVGLVWVLGH